MSSISSNRKVQKNRFFESVKVEAYNHPNIVKDQISIENGIHSFVSSNYTGGHKKNRKGKELYKARPSVGRKFQDEDLKEQSPHQFRYAITWNETRDL